jgi:hypothetical protein
MQLTSLHVDWTMPRTWFVTVRLLEVAAAVTIAGAVFQTWFFFDSVSRSYGNNGEPLAGGPPFLDRVAMFAVSGFGFGFGQAPLMTALAGMLLLAVLAALHYARPVSNSGLLRWEVFAIWLAGALLTLALLASIVVGLVKGDPNGPPEGTVTYEQGPGTVALLLNSGAAPVLSLLVLAIVALWWLRLPTEFEQTEDAPAKEHRTRPAPAPDANTDDIVLDGVEIVEPVERLRPREGAGGGVAGDGSTPSGYDDYFRRF